MMKNKISIFLIVLCVVFFVSFVVFSRNNPAFLMEDVSDLCKEFYCFGFLHAFFIFFGIFVFGFVYVFELIKSKKNDPT